MTSIVPRHTPDDVRRRRVAGLVRLVPWLLVFALAIGAGSFASASPKQTRGARIYACATSVYGTLNLTDANRRCPAGQRKISWEADSGQGPAGRAGDRGVAGPRGLAGIPGLPGQAGKAGSTGDDGATGSKGVTGAIGAAGSRGATGSSGATGATGAVGPVGPIGPRGASGVDGPVGPQGPAGEQGPAAPAEYGYVFSDREQVVEPGADVQLHGEGVLTPGITHEPDSAEIGVGSTGTYAVAFSVSGDAANQFGLSIKDDVIPGSVYGAGTGPQQNAGSLIVNLTAGDRLTLRNVGDSAAVTLRPDTGGRGPAVNAAVTITRLPDAKPRG